MRIGEPGAERPALLDDAGRLLDVTELGRDYDGGFFAAGGLQELRAIGSRRSRRIIGELEPGGGVAVLGGARIGAPIARPQKVIRVGRNYAGAGGDDVVSTVVPESFQRASSQVVGPGDRIFLPREPEGPDWGVSLAVIVGRSARYLESPDAAVPAILGYALSTDISGPDPTGARRKASCVLSNPLGPWLATPDEVPDVQMLTLRLWVDRVLRQDGTTENMIFDVPYLIWYLSQFVALQAGDLINTGTPMTVSSDQNGVSPLMDSELIEAEGDGLGLQENPVEAV